VQLRQPIEAVTRSCRVVAQCLQLSFAHCAAFEVLDGSTFRWVELAIQVGS
jgi:hypothetical protein